MSTWQNIKGTVAGVVALIACPCHLPITFPLLLSLTAGTALGNWLEGKFGLVFTISAVIFIGGLGLAYWWSREDEKPAGRARRSGVTAPTKRHPLPEGKPVTIQIVTSSTCKSCDRVQAVWEQVGQERPLTIEVIDINSARGRELAANHNIFTTPTSLMYGKVVARGVPSLENAHRAIGVG